MATTVSIVINGSEARTRVQKGSLVIHDVINDAPNTCSFTIRGTAPVARQTIRVTVNTTTVLFNGTIQTVTLTHEGKNRTAVYQCTAADDLAALNKTRPFGTWASTSATTIAQSLVTNYASGFTSTHVAAALPSISIVFDGSETFSQCMARIASLIGGYYYAEDGDLHLFLTEASSTPDTIDTTSGRFLDVPAIAQVTDVSQLRTRVYGRGYGASVLGDVVAGTTSIPVSDISPFDPSGGDAISGSNVLTYTGTAADPNAFNALGWEVQPDPTNVVVGARQWTGVIWVAALSLFVAVNASGSATSGVMTSPDGKAWTFRTAASTAGWSSLAWSPSLALLVAVANTGAVMTSPDGTTWTLRTSSSAQIFNCIAWSPTLGLFAAPGTNTTDIMTSPDGINWTTRTSPTAIKPWTSIVWVDTLALFVASGEGGVGSILTSANGTAWTLRTTIANATSVAWSPSLALLVTVGTGRAQSSTDGVTWTDHSVPSTNAWDCVVWAEAMGFFVALSKDSAGSANRVMVSRDGLLWSGQSSPTLGQWRDIAWSPELSRLVGVGNTGGTPTIYIMTADAGTRVAVAGTLTGVPSGGAGSIVADLVSGDSINIWVQRDDATAQSTYGVVEYLVRDERRNLTTLTALCDANLALFKNPIVTVTYASRDIKTKSGKSVTVSLSTPAISATLIIQEVTITEIDVAENTNPRFTVKASTVRFSLDDLLRQLLTASVTGVAA